jgi:hypothetical protein
MTSKRSLGLKVETRHELDDLWDEDIRRPERQPILEQIKQQPGGDQFRMDLRFALAKGKNAFIELRYFSRRRARCRSSAVSRLPWQLQ